MRSPRSIRRWLDRNDRIVSPKYLLGESYGGFRASPRSRAHLQSGAGRRRLRHGAGCRRCWTCTTRAASTDPFGWVDRLPSEVAAARALNGPVTRADVADAEQYAATDYLTDLLRGEHDTAALDRLTAHGSRR